MFMLINSFAACARFFDSSNPFPYESTSNQTPHAAEPDSKPGDPPDKEPAATEGLILPPPSGK